MNAMNGIDQITLHAPTGSTGDFRPVSSSLVKDDDTGLWLRMLKPWLRIGRSLGRCYLSFASWAAFIRWYTEPSSTHDWDYSVIYIGDAGLLTAKYALELPDLDERAVHAGAGTRWTRTPEHGPGHRMLEAKARSADAAALLVPLLAHTLAGERSVTMPWPEPGLPEAAIWGLVSILEMIGDSRPVSFLTYAAADRADEGIPGLLVSFRPGVPVVPPAPRYDALAARLAKRFAADPATLRRVLAENGVLEPANDAARIARLLEVWPGIEAGNADARGAQTMTEQSREARPAAPAQPPATTWVRTSREAVRCPICLHVIPDWDSLDYYKWDSRRQEYVPSPAQTDLNDVQLARHLQSAYVRCPNSEGDAGTAHYLPVRYGQFGNPVMLGFAGLTKSGKTHLMATMIGAIESGGLQEYGIASRPLDPASHLRFLQEQVEPLLNEDKQLSGTRENVRMFADAFLVRADGGPERPVVLFDVAGEDLAKEGESKEFLWIVDGLFFVIDPDFVSTQRVGDKTFANVLSAVHDSGRSQRVSAAIVMSKADKVRFDEPVARWLRFEGGELDAAEFLRESADVYAYLVAKEARALTRPYQDCVRATLHFASPTGGPSAGEPEHEYFPRGVTPRRVLRPLVAMLAMTGVLTGPEAEKVGI
jgi:hypothetical protein